MKKIVFLISLIGLTAVIFLIFFNEQKPDTATVPSVSFQEVREQESRQDPVQAIEDESEVVQEEDSVGEQDLGDENVEDEPQLPAEFNLAVPFTSQAPHGNWDLPYQEACEEASIYMVAQYYDGAGEGPLNPDETDKVLRELVAFQLDFLGEYLDTNAAQTVEVLDAFLGYRGYVVENPSVQQIKAEIAAGRPVIVPAAGKKLKNQFFTGDGPLYHMFVLRGYTEDKFITNDPGTRRGENYLYDIDLIMDANGDWNDGDPLNGKKVMIFTEK